MRISVWQQFSSNHSADFTLVGQFESVEQAQEVAQEIKTVIQTIADWWLQFDEETQRTLWQKHQTTKELTAPETNFKAQYGIEWRWLDWITGYEGIADESVFTFDDLVFVENLGSTWVSSQPFDGIMRLRGGKLACDCELDEAHYLALNITCTAPDEATADELYKMVTGPKKTSPEAIRLPTLGVGRTTGEVQQHGCRLEFKHIQLRFAGIKTKIPQTFQIIVDFLQSYGCTDIEYTFVEAPYPQR